MVVKTQLKSDLIFQGDILKWLSKKIEPENESDCQIAKANSNKSMSLNWAFEHEAELWT